MDTGAVFFFFIYFFFFHFSSFLLNIKHAYLQLKIAKIGLGADSRGSLRSKRRQFYISQTHLSRDPLEMNTEDDAVFTS